MKSSTSRILIETIVRKTLREIKDSPERSTRNLVDMALHCSKGKFQKSFLSLAQTMLQNEYSPYYKLIQDTVCRTDSEKLLRFGMNLGYNGCAEGAQRIRLLEKREGFHIPWAVTFLITPQTFSSIQERCHRAIAEGESLGIYTWFLFCDEGAREEVLTLAEEHPESAFILLCPASDITASLIDYAGELNNLMVAVRYDDEDAAEASELLHMNGLLHSVYFVYSEKTAKQILSGELFLGAEQLHPAFTALVPARGCSASLRSSVYEFAVHARKSQLYETFPWDFICDSQAIDEIISDKSCFAGFDTEGRLFTADGLLSDPVCTLDGHTLREIFFYAFPAPSPEADITAP